MNRFRQACDKLAGNFRHRIRPIERLRNFLPSICTRCYPCLERILTIGNRPGFIRPIDIQPGRSSLRYAYPISPMGYPMVAAVKRIAPQTQCYQRRRPEKTLWYRTVQAHFETWLALATGPCDESPPVYIEQAFRRYLDCGILANGFARAHCDECGHDFLIAFSCKGRGVCPSCNTRRMARLPRI